MTDEPAPPINQSPRGNSRTIFYVLLLLLLLGINVYLYVKYNQRSTRNQQLSTQIINDSTQILT